MNIPACNYSAQIGNTTTQWPSLLTRQILRRPKRRSHGLLCLPSFIASTTWSAYRSVTSSQSIANVQLSRPSNIAHQLILIPNAKIVRHRAVLRQITTLLCTFKYANSPLEMPTSQAPVVDPISVSPWVSNGEFMVPSLAVLCDDGCSSPF